MSTPNTPPSSGSAPKAPATAQPQTTQPQGQPTPAQQAAVERRIKLKLEGKDVELPESEVIQYAQQGKVATQRFQEASKLKQEAEQLINQAKNMDPKEFFRLTGMDWQEWAENNLMEYLTRQQESPEQKKARENEEKLRKYEDEKKQAQERAQKEQIERQTAEARERLDKMFVQALSESGLPKTPWTVKRMAELQLLNIKNKYELSASQLAKIVREDYVSEQKALFGSAEGDQLMDILGPDLVKKLSKAQIAKLKAKGLQTSKPVSSSRQSSSSNTEGMSWREYQKRNRGR